MARFLIVGLGPSAAALADALALEGHVVNVVESADRGALEHVAIVCWLEGSSPESFLARSVDSSMRGFVYQAHGHERTVSDTARRNSIPFVTLRADPRRIEVWLVEALLAIGSLLEGRASALS